MEEEIDLRPYIAALLKNWYWIVGTAVAAAVVAFIVTSFLPPSYRATSLVAIANPQGVELQSLTTEETDPLFRSVTDNDPLAAVYPELALSDELMRELLQQIASDVSDISSIEELRSSLSASQGQSSSLLRLTVEFHNPEDSALIANAWAELFVPWANELFDRQGMNRVTFFEEQLVETEMELEQAEANLIAYQSENRSAVISNALTSATETQADYLSRQRRVTLLQQDVQNLREQLAASEEATLADQLTALNLQLRAFNAETAVPLEIQIATADSLTGNSRQAQIAFLENLNTTLDTYLQQIETQLAEIEPLILSLQQQNEEITVENNRLLRNRDVANEEYIALTRKVVEERISAQDASGGVQLVSRSAVPRFSSGPSSIIIIALSAFVGTIVAVIGVLLMNWWRGL